MLYKLYAQFVDDTVNNSKQNVNKVPIEFQSSDCQRCMQIWLDLRLRLNTQYQQPTTGLGGENSWKQLKLQIIAWKFDQELFFCKP